MDSTRQMRTELRVAFLRCPRHRPGRAAHEGRNILSRSNGNTRRLGRHDSAVRLLEQNFEKHQSALGPTHAQTNVYMHELAIAYGGAGPFKSVNLVRPTR